ncbi:MAG: hypothetical protein KAI47_19890 [Deltaproteobacteria bacterium]|nr:hypothetical protein [Deltaproteobacteria bacterium]
MLLTLAGGFGALVAAGLRWPGWVLAEIALWLLLGTLPWLLRRRPHLGITLWLVATLVALTGAALALLKPF